MTDMTFYRGETVSFAVDAVEADDTALQSPETATLSIVLSEGHGGAVEASFSSAPQVTLDAASTFVFTLTPADLAGIDREKIHYNIWSDNGGVSRLQLRGVITLIKTTEAA